MHAEHSQADDLGQHSDLERDRRVIRLGVDGMGP